MFNMKRVRYYPADTQDCCKQSCSAGVNQIHTITGRLNLLDRNINHYLYQRIQEHFQPVHILIFSTCTYNRTIRHNISTHTNGNKGVCEHQYFQIK